MTATPFDLTRPGLDEALAFRARFTRHHRGAFAVPSEGEVYDSSATPSAWHAGDRIDFAWHGHGDIIFARFRPSGELLVGPRRLGTGRWPRIAAREAATAVAFTNDRGSVIQTEHDSDWSDERAIEGTEIAIAWSSGGSLYAATTAGLWRVVGESVERIDETPLRRPALAVTSDGPVVAAERDGHIVCDGTDLGEGSRPSLAADDRRALHLSYMRRDGVVVRTKTADGWSEPVVVPVRDAECQAVALGRGDEVRVSFLAPASHGPRALWLVRLPDPHPILMPSLAGNFGAAWLTVDFGLSGVRNDYGAHDLMLTINEQRVKLFKKDLRNGRHLFRLNPFSVITSPGKPVENSVAIRSRHANGGHYRIATDFRLTVRTPWRERWGFVSSEEELRQAPEPLRVNHGMPDLAILANDLNLPVEPPETDAIDLHLIVANVGEATSERCEMQMIDGEEVLATVQVPSLTADDQWSVILPLRHVGRQSVEFKLRQETADFDPSNDSMTVWLWRTREGADEREPILSPAIDASVELADLQPATDFTLPSGTDESLFRLSDHAGKVVLINWWRTTCGYSQQEAPRLVDLWNHRRAAGLVILGVSDDTAESVNQIPAYLEHFRVSWPVALNDQGEFQREIVGRGRGETPGNYLVTRDGRFAYLGVDRSDADWRRLEAAVERALGQAAPAGRGLTARPAAVAPPLVASDLAGRSLNLQEFAGQPMVINFFTRDTFDWAGDVLIRLHEDLSAQGLRVLGVSAETAQELRLLVERHRIPLPVLRTDWESQTRWLGREVGWGTVFIDRHGRVVKLITDSIENGLEFLIFPKYARQLLS